MHRVSRMMKIRLAFVAVAAMMLILACGDNECDVVCNWQNPTIDNIWPNQNGTFWSYEYTWRTWYTEVPRYPEEDSLPPIPTFDEIEEVLGHHPIGSDADTVVGAYSLEFDGMTTTPAGVTTQNLVETLVEATRAAPQAGGAAGPQGFLARVLMARPDLKDKIKALCPTAASHLQPETPPTPLMIHGGAWEKTGRWIGTYGDIDTLLAWKFLEADLTKGHEFTHQLIPSISSDIFLHCRVLGRTVVKLPDGRCRGAVECLYLVDYGAYGIPGPSGPVGWQRFYDYGRVFYVPGIGPVSSYERTLVSVGEPIQSGYGDIAIELSGTNLDTD